VLSLESIKLMLSSYGPFERLELNLTPITVFTGPNVTGKSFLLRANYAMLAPCNHDVLDVGVVISRLCNNSMCSEPVCLNKVLKKGSQILEVKLNAWGYKRSLRYDTRTGNVEFLEADCVPVESILVPGYRIYLVSQAYYPIDVEIPISGSEPIEKYYVDAMSRELRSLLEKAPDIIKGDVEELIENIVSALREIRDLKTYVKAFMKITGTLDKFIFTLTRQGIEAHDVIKIKNIIEESLNALVLLYMSPPVSDIMTLLRPIVSRLEPELEIGKTHRVKLGEVASEIERIIAEKLFPEVKYLDISLPGISEMPSNIPLLPASILHSYSLVASLAYAEKLSQAGIRVVLLVEEPELGLDFKRQRMLAEYIVSAVKRANGMLTVMLSTHSAEMLISLTKEIARKKMRKYARVCEVTDGKVKCRSISKTGRVYVKHMFEELGEIYSDV